MAGFKRKIFCGSTTGELEDKLNSFEEQYAIIEICITAQDSNNSPSGLLFLASVVYKY